MPKNIKMKHFQHIIWVVLAIILLVGCKQTTTQKESSVAQLRSFSFTANDSIPGLAAAVFTIKELADTSLVYNEDSILFGTPLDTVVPKFSFMATPSSAIIFMPDTLGTGIDTIMLSGADTLDFTRQPVILRIVSQDKSTTKYYRIEAYVHQVDPDLFTWRSICSEVAAGDFESQVLMLNDAFVMLTNDGLATHAFSSVDGKTWAPLSVSATLPSGCNVRSIISDGETLYYVHANSLYTSTDGAAWTQSACALAGYTVHTMLMSFNDTIWAVAEEDATGSLYLAKCEGTTFTLTDVALADNFPIGGFATVTFPSASNRARALVMGGYSRLGESLNSRWAFEYSAVEKKYRVKNFTIEQPSFHSLTGASLVWYNNMLFLFGGIDADALFGEQPILVSLDEGMNWSVPDSTHCMLPQEYAIRQKQSAIVLDNNIYLFGGQSRTQTYSDVYVGRLASIDWEK